MLLRHKINKICFFCFRKVFFGLRFEKQAIICVITTLEFLHVCCVGNISSSASPSFRTEFLDFFWPQGLISTAKFMYRYHLSKLLKNGLQHGGEKSEGEIGGVYLPSKLGHTPHFASDGRKIEWKVEGVHPQPSPGWAEFTIVIECKPESGHC